MSASYDPPAGVTGTPSWGNGPPPWVTALATSTPAIRGQASLATALTSASSQLVASSSPTGPPQGGPSPHGPMSAGFPDGGQGGLSFSADSSNVLTGVTCVFLILCTAAVIGRLAARRISRVRLEADDFMVMFSLLTLIALSIEQFLLARNIASIPSHGPPSTSLMESLRHLGIASQLTYNFLITSARLSVLLLYRRIFSLNQKWFRIAWWTCTVITLLFFLGLTGAFLSQCGIISKCPAHSSRRSKWGIPIVAFINIGVDISVLVLPMRIVWMLQLSDKRKWGVSALFGLGFIGVGVSIARAIAVSAMDGDPRRAGVPFACWSTAEAAVALLCANLSILRPLFTTAYHKLSTARNPQAGSTGQQESRERRAYHKLSGTKSPEPDSRDRGTQMEGQRAKGMGKTGSEDVEMMSWTSTVWGLDEAREDDRPGARN